MNYSLVNWVFNMYILIIYFTVPSEDVMREIIQDALIIREWKHVARKLGISEADIEDIDYKESGLKDKCYEMLSTWRKSNGLSGTMGLLMMMLREINHNTIPGM